MYAHWDAAPAARQQPAPQRSALSVPASSVRTSAVERVRRGLLRQHACHQACALTGSIVILIKTAAKLIQDTSHLLAHQSCRRAQSRDSALGVFESARSRPRRPRPLQPRRRWGPSRGRLCLTYPVMKRPATETASIAEPLDGL